MMTDKRPSGGNDRDAEDGADLGQKEAELEKTKDEQLSHMQGGKPSEKAKEKAKDQSN
jgi:hypothetical protein